ncbi:MAG: tetratricopeptide repeat protein [Burkholderiales bacterium]|nr:tetratricopeptide repeat protein [Burkholderiales bacterium]
MRFLPLLLLTVTVLYWPGLHGEFVFDDQANLVANPSLRVFDGSLSSLLDAGTGGAASPLGRPLSLASFAANYHFWGETPFFFKLTNLLIHLANGLLVYWLAKTLLPRLSGTGSARMAPLWVAALWLLHPINLTPVLFVVQRMTSLSAFFTLAALNFYLHGRPTTGRVRWPFMVLSFLVCWPAGILAKETAILLPLFVLLCEWLALGGLRAVPATWLRYGTTLIVLGASIVLFLNWQFVANTYQYRDFTLGERLLTESRVLWMYIGQILLPWPGWFSLHHDDIAISHDLFVPPLTLPAILGWLFLAGFAIRQRERRPWLAFAMLWFLIGHALESSLLGLELAYEHRNYLPSIGIFLGFSVLLLPRREAGFGRLPRQALAWSFVALCALVTGLRAAQWGDELVRTQIESANHPESARTHFEAARAILARQLPGGEIATTAFRAARIHFQQAAELNPHGKAALASILYLDCAVGQPPDLKVRRQLHDRLGQARFTPGEEGFVQGLSDLFANDLLCLSERDVEALLAAALANPAATARIQGMLHAVAMDYAAVRHGSLPQARQHAQAAVESDPGNAVLRINLIRVLLRLGETTEAQRQYAVLRTLRVPAANRREVENLGLGLGK